jgi:hypothetical protein
VHVSTHHCHSRLLFTTVRLHAATVIEFAQYYHCFASLTCAVHYERATSLTCALPLHCISWMLHYISLNTHHRYTAFVECMSLLHFTISFTTNTLLLHLLPLLPLLSYIASDCYTIISTSAYCLACAFHRYCCTRTQLYL